MRPTKGMAPVTKRILTAASLVPAVAMLATLAAIPFFWSFSYFYRDDFNLLFWSRRAGIAAIGVHLLNPASDFFRPFGMLFYGLMDRVFGLEPLPFHALAWSLHGLNAALLFLLLRTLLHSRFAAAAGVIPFLFRAVFSEVYWSFGAIFELLCLGLMLLGMLWYVRSRESWLWMAAATIAYYLAVKSKEVAVTLAAVWLLYDAIVTRDLWGRPGAVAARLACPSLIALWFTWFRVRGMGAPNPTDAYFMDVRLETMLSGFLQYFRMLGGSGLPQIMVWLALLAVVAFLLHRRDSLGIFFVAWMIMAFLPVIFLTNRRTPLFWYIPFVGVSGLFGVAAKCLLTTYRWKVPLARVVLVNAALLTLLAAGNVSLEWYRSRQIRETERRVTPYFQGLVRGLRSLPEPDANATLYFRDVLPGMDEGMLTSVVNVVLARDDVHARLVRDFPPEARWRLSLAGGRLQAQIPH